ncbi:MAG: ATP-binding protein [Pirellulaceae bacterium]|jgi:hypothetical protein|nr:ATPase [Planctomycetaceae bacterium]MDP6557849.1 ATP-binding protein [Pirellulaceae bacterium]
MSSNDPPRHVVGRSSEKERLAAALNSPDPELIAIYGRRRVGKTFLIREFFRNEIVFELTGLHNEPMGRQLENCAISLRRHFPGQFVSTPPSWLEAFEQIKDSIQASAESPTRKQVLFFDEFPWLATRRSGFLAAFEAFWNTFASRRPDLMVIICGSAASWMIRKVINSKGGLHNRTTVRICLKPFTLHETREYLEHRRVKLSEFQMAQLYMAVGGVPHYLNYIQPGQSVAQNIDRLCFAKDGLLVDEYQHLYAALFDDSTNHESIVRALASTGRGLTRNELLTATSLKSGGAATSALRELIQSGFVHECPPRNNKTKDAIFRLADEYSLFYLKWIKSNRTSGTNIWLQKAAGRKYASWCGYAFESLCLKHIVQIKVALGIAGVETTESSWFYRPKSKNGEGAQIDLVIDRRDQCINISEMKFSENPFVINKRYAADLARKLRVFRERTGSKSTLFLTMITSSGVKQNDYARDLVTSEVLLADLFASP